MELQLILARLRDAAELYRQLAAARRDADDGARRQDSLTALDAEYADDLSSASTQRQQRERQASRPS
jgi:hypothetical protein